MSVGLEDVLATASGREAHPSLLPTLRELAPNMRRRAKDLAGGNDILREDLESAGLMGMVEAVSAFDANRGVPLRAFATQYANHRMLDELRKFRASAEARLEFVAMVDLDHEDASEVQFESALPLPLDELIQAEFAQRIEQFATTLPFRQREVLRGLVIRSLSQADVSRELRVSRAAVSKIVEVLRDRVRQYEPLRDFLMAA